MKQYGMSFKTGKDIIMLTRQDSLESAVQYFAEIKQLSLKKFKEIFIVVEIKEK